MKTIFSMIALLAVFTQSMSAVDKAFPQTDVGETEIKILPESRLIMSETEGSYFRGDNGLFRPLFRYISSNDIAMTTPVEAEMAPGRMYFYLGEDVSERDFQSTDTVEVVEVPARKVASIGARGGYSEKNFEAAKAELEAWLANHPTYEAAGDARGVFWNGPYVPSFLKRFEVHVPVKERVVEE